MSSALKGIEDGLGPFLRREREARGVSLREVSEETRIRTFYLERIEEGEFSRLPPGPVSRGFVRAYATSIGVESDAAARQYDREVGILPEDALDTIAISNVSRRIATAGTPPRRGNPRVVIPVVAIGVFLIACATLLWFLRGRTDRLVPVSGFAERIKAAAVPAMRQLPKLLNKTTSPKGLAGREEVPPSERVGAAASPGPAERPLRLARSSASLAEASRPSENETEAGAAAVVPRGENSNEDKGKEASPPRDQVASASAEVAVPGAGSGLVPGAGPGEGGAAELDLKVLALEDTWLRIVVDKKETEELLLMAGNEKKWRGSEKFILTVGNVSGTEVSLNGTRIPLPRNSSNIVRDFVVTEKLLN